MSFIIVIILLLSATLVSLLFSLPLPPFLSSMISLPHGNGVMNPSFFPFTPYLTLLNRPSPFIPTQFVCQWRLIIKQKEYKIIIIGTRHTTHPIMHLLIYMIHILTAMVRLLGFIIHSFIRNHSFCHYYHSHIILPLFAFILTNSSIYRMVIIQYQFIHSIQCQEMQHMNAIIRYYEHSILTDHSELSSPMIK
jgi:hypothetical protein